MPVCHKVGITTKKRGFEYFTACTMNLQYMKVSILNYITEENELLHNILICWHGSVYTCVCVCVCARACVCYPEPAHAIGMLVRLVMEELEDLQVINPQTNTKILRQRNDENNFQALCNGVSGGAEVMHN